VFSCLYFKQNVRNLFFWRLKMERMKLCVLVIALASVVFASAACTKTPESGNTSNSNTTTPNTTTPNTTTPNTANETQGPTAAAGTPTAAYKALFDAVKRKDTEGIKRNMSKETLNLAQMMSQTYKKTLEKSLENGMTESTMQPTFPQIRNEKINGNQATIDVSKPNGQWETLPFVKEDGGWKLAFGEVFSGKINITPTANANTTPMIPGGPGGANTGQPNANASTMPPNPKRRKIDERKPIEKEKP
jgi:hypothetical protein